MIIETTPQRHCRVRSQGQSKLYQVQTRYVRAATIFIDFFIIVSREDLAKNRSPLKLKNLIDRRLSGNPWTGIQMDKTAVSKCLITDIIRYATAHNR
jgi:hypothetical protein